MCSVLGGPFVPCQPDEELERIERDTGRPCPRMLLHEKNVDAWQMLNMRVTGDEGGLAAYGSAMASYHSPEEYRKLFARLQAVQSDPRFTELLEDMRERYKKDSPEETSKTDADAWMQCQ